MRCQIILRNIGLRPLHRQLSSDTGHLAYSLIDFYTFIYEEKDHSSQLAKKVPSECMESLEKYIALRSEDSHNLFVIHARTRILQTIKALFVKDVEWFPTAVKTIGVSSTFITRRQEVEA